MSVYRSEQGACLERALQSVWDDQTRKPDQIVLIEDGELTTELYEVVNRWKERLGEKLTLCVNESGINEIIEQRYSDCDLRLDCPHGQ